ncbi:MAG: transcriptional repressor LexA [Clostridiales bacterium]|nr:transcriptional repressor LexA [Clostridiales bacterium]
MGKGDRTRQKIFDFVRIYIEENGYSPTVREVCAGVGLKSPSSAFGHLKTLAQEGRIAFNHGQKRSIALPEQKGAPVMVPLVGRVTAGLPILAVEELEGYLPMERELARGRELFALRVKGDSMKNAAIEDGDIVVVEQCPTADNGDIVVALLEEEATVKRFFKERGGFRLQPENEAYSPILTDQLVLLGRVVALYRSYR